MMIHRVASVLLVMALVWAGGSVASAQVPRTNRRPRQPVGCCERSLCEAGHLRGNAADATTLVGGRRHHSSVTLATVAVTRPSVRVGATPALVGFSMAGIVPDFWAQPLPVATNTRPVRRPRVVLPARAPPV